MMVVATTRAFGRAPRWLLGVAIALIPGVVALGLALRQDDHSACGAIRSGLTPDRLDAAWSRRTVKRREQLEGAAKAGDSNAQLQLGLWLRVGGLGFTRDVELARTWLMRAAVTQGDAAYHMGSMTLAGEGAARDVAIATRWFERAATLGSAQAMYMLGNVYREGHGTSKDPARALAWYRRAAEREHAAALQELALVYAHGELGQAPDPEEARRYAMEAAHVVGHPQGPY
jgi:TPR repeat protein